MARPTGKSWVERELRTPKYRSRVETDEKKETKIRGYSVDFEIFDEYIECIHGYLSGCPLCKQED